MTEKHIGCWSNRIISYRVFQKDSLTVTASPGECVEPIGYRSLGTSDRHGEDFETIRCGKPCVLNHSGTAHHYCDDHLQSWIDKNVRFNSDEIMPQWRDELPSGN